ncbi:MAG TPA: hypothetical protein VGQ33_14080 [Vicinamibacteria bacterium]|nr:hypothetical protein [Vicinamibacteria bacterium]
MCKINEARLAALGVPKTSASRYFLNGNYTLTMTVKELVPTT